MLDRREFLASTASHAACWAAGSGLAHTILRSASAGDADAGPAVAGLAEFLEYRPLRPLPSTLAEWDRDFGDLRQQIRRNLGIPLLEEELSRRVEVEERGRPIVPDGWHYRIRRLNLRGVHGVELPVNVYEPTNGEKHAGGFVYVTGHINPSKEWPEGQQIGANLAERGIVAVALDYFSFGERDQPGNAHSVGTFSYTGLTATGLEVSDAMVVVNYLLQRGDVDARHIGCTGWSGGGHLTQWLGVVDDRVTLVVPCVGTCDYLWMWLRPQSSGRNECWHMRIPGHQRYADMGLAFGSIAPHRLRVINEQGEVTFNLENAEPLIERARRVYALYGRPEWCDLRCPNLDHNYDASKQEQLYEAVNEAFFEGRHELGSRVLQTPQFPSERLRVGIEGTRTFASVYAERIAQLPPADSLALPRDGAEAHAQSESLRRATARLLSFEPAPAPSRVLEGRAESRDGLTTVSRQVLTETFGARHLAVRTWEVKHAQTPPRTLLIIGRPDAQVDPPPPELARRFRLLFIEPRDDSEHSNRLQTYGIFYGRPALGMKVQDVVRAAEALVPAGEAVGIVGLARERPAWNTGDAGEIALFTALLSPRIARATVRLSVASYKEQALADPHASDYASVPGVLEVGDLPQFVAAALPRPIQLIRPANVSSADLRSRYAWVEQYLRTGFPHREPDRLFRLEDEVDWNAVSRWHTA